MSRLTQQAPRRPWSLWIFSLILAGIGTYNLLLAFEHVVRAGEYRALGVSYPPLLRAILALGWGVALLALGVGLVRRSRRARRWTLALLSNYGAFGVLWMIVFAQSDFARGRIAFQAILTAALVLLAAWVLRWRRVRVAFGAAADARSGAEPAQVEQPERNSGEMVL